MSLLASVLDPLVTIGSYFATLTLAALGLGIIFGMMGVINLAHGEFIMIGFYSSAMAVHAGIPLPVAVLVGGATAGVFGYILERVLIRHLYNRPIDSMVVTWGVSISLVQATLIIFGPTLQGISPPLGPVSFAGFSTSGYRFVTIGSAIALLIATYFLFTRTEYGLHARATMQNDEMANAIGINTPKIYTKTFVLGCVMAGLAGGIFLPQIGRLVPTLGASYLIEAFVTVIVGGGTSILVGLPAAAGLLGIINGGVASWGGAMAGRIALLVVTILLIRILPEGLSQYYKSK
jgi:branched-chain amino acid transport system permease protein